jgi:tRNA(fMet)-specific endonuclease VapC
MRFTRLAKAVAIGPRPISAEQVYCFDTDVLSATMRREPLLPLIRRLAQVPPPEQFTTAVTLGELLYGAARRDSDRLRSRVSELVRGALTVLPFDERAAKVYGPLRAQLEAEGRRLDEPDMRIASIALSRELTLVTGNVRHFDRVPGLTVENWLA